MCIPCTKNQSAKVEILASSKSMASCVFHQHRQRKTKNRKRKRDKSLHACDTREQRELNQTIENSERKHTINEYKHKKNTRSHPGMESHKICHTRIYILLLCMLYVVHIFSDLI